MEKVVKELKSLREDVEKIKVFCAYVVAEHDHLPNLRQVWNHQAGKHIYYPNTAQDDINMVKAVVMKAILELEERIEELEQLVS
jgi:hypothetical protein